MERCVGLPVPECGRGTVDEFVGFREPEAGMGHPSVDPTRSVRPSNDRRVIGTRHRRYLLLCCRYVHMGRVTRRCLIASAVVAGTASVCGCAGLSDGTPSDDRDLTGTSVPRTSDAGTPLTREPTATEEPTATTGESTATRSRRRRPRPRTVDQTPYRPSGASRKTRHCRHPRSSAVSCTRARPTGASSPSRQTTGRSCGDDGFVGATR